MVIECRCQLWLIRLASLVVAVMTFSAGAQTVSQEYGQLVTATSQVKGLEPGLAGEEINLYSGQLGLSQTDISLPGNSQLLVDVTRRFNAASTNGSGPGFFQDWDMALPSIHGVFSTRNGWSVANTGSDRYKRCSKFGPPLEAFGNPDGYFAFNEFWYGTFAFLPGRGDQELLHRDEKTAVPADGRTYPVVLADGSALSCLNSLDSTSSPADGEGFELVTREGIRYRFDHMVTRYHQGLKKSSSFTLPASMSKPAAPNGYVLLRTEYWLYPTSVTDRFGNKVIYTWNPVNPNQLRSISSSDGREITFAYTDTSGYRIQSISAAGRTWTYIYNGSFTLTQVLLPDQSSWKFNLRDVGFSVAGEGTNSHIFRCDGTRETGDSSSGTVTHPSGAVVSFKLKAIRMPRTYVPRSCGEMEAYAIYPKEINSMALVSKNISGPSLPVNGLSWTYVYDNAEGCWDPVGGDGSAYECTNTTSGVRTTTVTKPDGSTDQFYFGNRFRVNEGLLLTRRSGVSGNNALQIETRSYAASDAGPYPKQIGYSYQGRGDGDFASRHHPLSKRLIQQDGASFSWSVSKFDAAARPVEIIQTGQ